MFQQVLASAKSNSITKIEENLVARFEYFGRAPHIEIITEPEIARLRSNITFPHYLFNVVARSQFSTLESAHAHITNVIKDVEPRGTSVFWVDGPSTQPINLGYYLEAHGFKHVMRGCGMSLDLSLLKEDVVYPSGLKVERVTNRVRLRQFVDVLAQNSHLTRSATQAMYEIEDHLGFEHYLPRQRYLGLWHGEPVATITLFSAAGVVGIYHVATVPQARGYGIASAMSKVALQDGRWLGHQQATLIATTMGESVYRRLGFQPRADFNIYLWAPK